MLAVPKSLASALVVTLVIGGYVLYGTSHQWLAASTSGTTSTTPQAYVIPNAPSGWKIYHNAKYGFAFAYPPEVELTETPSTFRNGDVTGVGSEQFGFFINVVEKKGLSIGGRNSEGTFYDHVLGRWFSSTYAPSGLAAVRCDTEPFGAQQLSAMMDGGGDAGYSSSVAAILTNRDHAILIYTFSDSYGDEQAQQSTHPEAIVDTFMLTNGVEARTTECGLPSIPVIPAVVAPTSATVIRYPVPLSVNFAAPLPPGVGALVSIKRGDNERHIGRITSGSSGVIPFTNSYNLSVEAVDSLKQNGPVDVILRFYKTISLQPPPQEGGTEKDIYLGEAHDKTISTTLLNTAPYSFSAVILPDAQNRWYVAPDGAIVLVNTDTTSIKNGIFFQDMVRLTATNMYQCYVKSPWGTTTSDQYAPEKERTFGVLLRNISNTLPVHSDFTQEFGCYAPDGTHLSETFTYRVP